MTEHPRREDYPSDVEFWRECMRHLDELYPRRVEQRLARAAAWSLMLDPEGEVDRTAVIARIRELVGRIEAGWSDAEAAEFSELSRIFRGESKGATS